MKVGNISEGIVNLLESEVVAKFREAQLGGIFLLFVGHVISGFSSLIRGFI